MITYEFFSEKDIKSVKKSCIDLQKVCVWIIRWDYFLEPANLDFTEYLRGTLSPEELARSLKYYFPDYRYRSYLSRGLVRILGASYTGINLKNIDIIKGYNGKPAFSGEASDLKFNISHSGEYIMMAFTFGREIGVDVEKQDSKADFYSMSELFAHEEESLIKRSCDYCVFYDTWVCKEAFIKYTGEGLARSLNSFTVRGDDIIIDGRIQDKLLLKRIKVNNEYAAAMVVEK